MEKLAVLMSVYNGGNKVIPTIRSILNQSHINFRFYIIDDGSIDDTKEIIDSFNDIRIKYFYKEHSGLADSLNYGLKKIDEEFVARIDAGDIAHPLRLEKQLQYFLKNPSCDVLATAYLLFANDRILEIKYNITDSEMIKKLFFYKNQILHSSIMYKKNKMLKAGGYNNYPFEDYEFWVRVKDCCRFANLNEVLMYIRSDKNSLSKRNLSHNETIVYNFLIKNFNKKFWIDFKFDKAKRFEYLGWREFYWGEKTKARVFWLGMGCAKILIKPKIFMGIVISLLPVKTFQYFKQKNILSRSRSFFMKFSREYLSIKNDFFQIHSKYSL